MPTIMWLVYRRAVISLLLFGLSFGYAEAATVSYLRALFEPVRQQYYPGRSPDDLFPLPSLNQVVLAQHEYLRIVGD